MKKLIGSATLILMLSCSPSEQLAVEPSASGEQYQLQMDRLKLIQRRPYNPSKGSKFANSALNMARKKDHTGLQGDCYAYVANVLEAWGVIPKLPQHKGWTDLGIGLEHAYQFGLWIDNAPVTASEMLNLRRAYPQLTQIPLGSVLV